ISVHLLTLPQGKERDSAGKLLRQRPVLGALAGGVASCQGRPEVAAAFLRTCRGDCVEADPDSLLDEETREKTLKEIRGYFAPGPREQRQLRFTLGHSHPKREIKNDVIRFSFENAIEDNDHHFRADVALILEADAATLRPEPR